MKILAESTSHIVVTAPWLDSFVTVRVLACINFVISIVLIWQIRLVNRARRNLMDLSKKFFEDLAHIAKMTKALNEETVYWSKKPHQTRVFDKTGDEKERYRDERL